MSLPIISALKARWNFSLIPKTLCITLVLSAAICVQSMYAQRGNIRAGNGIKEKRDSVLTLNLDTMKVDSIAKAVVSDTADALRALIGPGNGRTYIYTLPEYGNALVVLDSTDAAYYLYVPFATIPVEMYRNFANAANDSAVLQTAIGGQHIFPPASGVFTGYDITFSGVSVRTTFGTSAVAAVFPENITTLSADTCIYSARLVCNTISGTRNYSIRIYKHYTSSFSGINAPLTNGTLVTSVAISNTLFPSAQSSTYASVVVGYRRVR